MAALNWFGKSSRTNNKAPKPCRGAIRSINSWGEASTRRCAFEPLESRMLLRPPR